MKRYLILALALFAFAVAPVMADVALSGVLRAGGLWDLGEEESTSRLDRTRFLFKAGIDDFSTFNGQFRGARPVGSAEAGKYNGHDSDVPIALYTATVKTDWAKYFGFADTLGVVTTVGYDGSGTFSNFDKLDYTIYGIGGIDLALGEGYTGFRVDLDIAGIVKPYFATPFRANILQGTEDVHQYIVGAGIDFKPIWVEAYFMQNGINKDDRSFSAEVEFAQAIQDGVDLKVGAVLLMTNPLDEWTYAYNVLASLSAAGATFGAALYGDEDYTVTALALSVKYDVVEFFGLQAGTKIGLDTDATGEAFLGAEFGIYLKPGKVKYDLGYAIINDSATGYGAGGEMFAGNTITGLADGIAPGGLNTKGGIYFSVNARY